MTIQGEEPEDSTEKSRGPKSRILVVDDEALIDLRRLNEHGTESQTSPAPEFRRIATWRALASGSLAAPADRLIWFVT